jgi:glutamine amidotransferase-like uncharacterized protein
VRPWRGEIPTPRKTAARFTGPIGVTGCIGVALITAALIAGCQSREEAGRSAAQQNVRQAAPQPSPEKIARVAIYSDRGVWPPSVTAAERMFLWMGYDVTRVSAPQVRHGALAEVRLLCVPGGNMFDYAEDLTAEGAEKIRTFVERGGGYVGICGGAYLAGERVYWHGNRLPMTSLGLFSGEARGPYDEIVPYPDSAMCLVIASRPSHPISENQPDSSWILYFWGPALLPDEDAQVTVLGWYDAIDRPAMLATEYGQGRIFLIGTHPEIEEDSDRDGVAECDELEDRGSDWELMRAATRWCLRE